jgi:hypothetical protein
MIAKEVLGEVQDNLTVKPINHSILVLVPLVSEITETGIIKGESIMREEENLQEAFLTVVAVADDVEVVQPGDRVYIQGTVNTFSGEALPRELDIAPDGYTIGHTLDMYIKMKV